MFENNQLQSLPKHQYIAFKPLADKALLHAQLNWLIFYVPLMAVFAAICFFNEDFADKAQLFLLIGLPILLVISLLYNVLSVRLKGVAMREHDIAYRKGMIWQQVTILPFSRVQHTEIHRGPIERKLGLASLRLYSAGGVSADLNISGLSHDDCKDIRQYVQQYNEGDQKQSQQQRGHSQLVKAASTLSDETNNG
ncbi:MAG: PH domain-containing protein [Pseudoalteromonas sp.]|uniref:PH domain-containing protein n=1 Tax=unclassified Pseudoalteromonas TaxID=194690 RepID=UPI003F960DC9